MIPAKNNVTRYDAVKLHDRSLDAWAVIGWPRGAIAVGDDERLLMRLNEATARDLAGDMSRVLRASSTYEPSDVSHAH